MYVKLPSRCLSFHSVSKYNKHCCVVTMYAKLNIDAGVKQTLSHTMHCVKSLATRTCLLSLIHSVSTSIGRTPLPHDIKLNFHAVPSQNTRSKCWSGLGCCIGFCPPCGCTPRRRGGARNSNIDVVCVDNIRPSSSGIGSVQKKS